MRTDFTAFNYVWRRLEEQGACDAIGGMEYRRVRLTWLAHGKPRPIDKFIRWQANLPSPGSEQARQMYGN